VHAIDWTVLFPEHQSALAFGVYSVDRPWPYASWAALPTRRSATSSRRSRRICRRCDGVSGPSGDGTKENGENAMRARRRTICSLYQ